MSFLYTNGSGRRRIVFAGGGHAHLYSLLRTGELTVRGYDVTLIAPDPLLHYSGMAPGVISGVYPPEKATIDVRYLVERGGGRFIRDSVADISTPDNTLTLGSSETLHYDALSVCLGSAVPDSPHANKGSLPVKPVENLRRLQDIFSFGKAAPKDILIVGGGPAGCEVACNLERLTSAISPETTISVADSHDMPLPTAPAGVRKAMLRHFSRRGICFMPESRIVASKDGIASTQDGREIPHDLLLLAVGISPTSLFRDSGLPTGPDDGLWVNHYLQSPAADNVFGGGDCVSFRGDSLPHLGVFAIRQGPVLFSNIVSHLEGLSLSQFEPQSRYLYILNLGDGTGIAVRGKVWWKGRAAWLLKRYIDGHFIARYRYPEMDK